jgi:hypothetical protein
MTPSALRRRIRPIIAAAAICAAVAGFISDLKAATAQKTDGSGQLRYYGGPKSSMWPGQTRGADSRPPESAVLNVNAGRTRPQPRSAPVKPVREN